MILQSSINMQGSVFIAGYAATNKIFGLLDCTSVSLGVACCTFLAQNYGAGKYDRVKQGVRTAVKISCIIGVSVTLVTLLFRESMLKLFLDVNEAGGPQALEVAVRYLTIMAITLIILYIQHVFSNTLEAMGIAVWSMYSGIAEFVGRVLMAKVVINWIGTDALFISEPVAWLNSTLLLILPYFHYKKKLLN